MTMKTYTAIFTNGTTITRQTKREYAFAFRVIIRRAAAPAYRDFQPRDAKVDIEFGFSSRFDLAEKAASAIRSGNTWVRPGAEPTTFETEIVACVRTK